MAATSMCVHSLAAATLLLLLSSHVNAGGYHYDPPAPPPSTSLHSIINTNSGHYFGPIPTSAPLPPVPALPALPTAPTRTRTQTIFQLHPASQGGQRSQGAPTAAPTQRPGNYNQGVYNAFGNYLRHGVENASGGSVRLPSTFYNNAPPTPIAQQLIGYQVPENTASPPSAPAGPTPPPLRIPFGSKQPFFSFGGDPDEAFYVVNGRQLKQYAVVEEVDNDISQDIRPFLTQSFFNNYRAQVGASGTGAIAPLPSAQQFSSTANAIVLEQQRLAQQQGTAGRRGDTIALGSGGIGYVRLPDGTITLGSGSLNFVTGQQHLEDLRNARTRSELQRDALHFGHGPFEQTSNQFLFK